MRMIMKTSLILQQQKSKDCKEKELLSGHRVAEELGGHKMSTLGETCESYNRYKVSTLNQ